MTQPIRPIPALWINALYGYLRIYLVLVFLAIALIAVSESYKYLIMHHSNLSRPVRDLSGIGCCDLSGNLSPLRGEGIGFLVQVTPDLSGQPWDRSGDLPP